MRATSLGHAGILIHCAQANIVCDPWFVPAFLGSWFPFPRNDRLAPDVMAQVCSPDYLYVSHLHGDHFDEPFLRERMSKSATVLLPEFPTASCDGGSPGSASPISSRPATARRSSCATGFASRFTWSRR